MRNFTRTTKIVLSLNIFALFMFLSTSSLGQLIEYEPMDYVAGNQLELQTGYTALNSGDSIVISSGSLSYTGLQASTGNKIAFDKWGIDASKSFTAQTTGTIYYSFLLNVTDLGGLLEAGGYFSALIANGTTFGATVWTRKNGAGYDIGVNPRTSAANTVWSTASYAINTTVFVVVSYEMDPSAGDVVKLWVNPTPGSAEPTTTLTATNTGTDLSSVAGFLIRQDSESETPFIEMDELRVGNTWADVTPIGATANPVTSITVTSANDSTTISTAGGTLQMSATVLPVDATIATVTWSVIDGTGHAIISETGLLTAVLSGTVTVRASANDGSGIYGEFIVTLNNQNPPILVSGITVTGANSATTIDTYHGTLQMSADVLPVDATDATYTWSVVNGTGTATISASGLLTAATDGVVTVVATANDASGVTGTLDITLSNQVIAQTSIYDIQYSTTGDSPLNGQVVTVTGTVTAVEGTKYYIQDAPGAWNGVYVYAFDNTPAIGDNVTITATVSEYNGLTELTSVTSTTINSSGNAVVSDTITTGAAASEEAYEGVLVTVMYAKCEVTGTTWDINDGTGTLKVYNKIYDYTTEVVDNYYHVTGVMTWYSAGSIYEIYPRSAADVVVASVNTEANITGFELAEQTGVATINATAGTVAIEVFQGTNLTALVPTITLSSGATINPASGVAQDFSSAVAYTVTAQDGSTTKNWTVTVTVSTSLNTAAEIVTFDFTAADTQAADEVINSAAGTVTVYVFPDVNVTNLTPTITLSSGATINPTSGTSQDFTNAVAYTVTAQDGTTQKTWTVTVVKQTVTSIYDIQYTTLTSGDSPLKGQTVTTTGTITAVKNYDSSNGLAMGYFIQSKGHDDYSGIYVESPNLFAVGDSIYVTGKVTEDYNFTIINNVISSKLTQPDKTVSPKTVTIAQINSEAYEGMFVYTYNASCSEVVNTYGEWKISSGSDTTNVDDLLLPNGAFSSITIDLNATYNISGVIYYSYGEYTLLPRDIAEVIYLAVDDIQLENVSIYPNPVNSTLHIDNVSNFDRIVVSNILGQQVSNYSNLDSNIEVDFNKLNEGVYFVSLISESNVVKTFKVVKK